MIRSEIRNASLKDKSYSCPQTICFAIVLLLVALLEFRNSYYYISSFVSNENDRVIIVLHNFSQSISTLNVIKRELVVDKEYYEYQMVISVLSSVLILYFVISALWLCWKCEVKSFASVFKKVVSCVVAWVALAILVMSIDLFFMIDSFLRMILTVVFLFIMFTVIDDYFMDMFNKDIKINII
jgi:hypothetical protein